MIQGYQKGFTLIEVMVSVAIVGSLIAVLSTIVYHMNISLKEEELLKATLLAKEKINESLKDSPNKGNFPPPNERFFFRKELFNTSFPEIKLLKVTVGTDKKDLITIKKFIRLKS